MTTVADFKVGDRAKVLAAAAPGSIATVTGFACNNVFLDCAYVTPDGYESSGYFYPSELKKFVPIPETIRQLRKVERLLNKLWVQGTWFLYKDGDAKKYYKDPTTSCGPCVGMCIEGAMREVAGSFECPAYKTLDSLIQAEVPGARNPINYNDDFGRTKEDVLKVVRKAINTQRRLYHV